MKPIKADHLSLLKKNKQETEIGVIENNTDLPDNVLIKLKENFENRRQLVEEFKEAKRNNVPGAKLGNADRGQAKDKGGNPGNGNPNNGNPGNGNNDNPIEDSQGNKNPKK